MTFRGNYIAALARGEKDVEFVFAEYERLVPTVSITADFHSVEFSELTGNPLSPRENIALNLNKILCLTSISFCNIQSARKILLSGNQLFCYFGASQFNLRLIQRAHLRCIFSVSEKDTNSV